MDALQIEVWLHWGSSVKLEEAVLAAPSINPNPRMVKSDSVPDLFKAPSRGLRGIEGGRGSGPPFAQLFKPCDRS